MGRRSHGAQARGGRGCPGGVCRESQPLRLWAPGSGAALLAVRGEHRCFSLPSESPQPEPGSPGTPHARSRRAAASAAGGLRGAGVRGSPARCAALTAASSVCASGERLEVIQQEVADLLKGRILVGHALRNDLKVRRRRPLGGSRRPALGPVRAPDSSLRALPMPWGECLAFPASLKGS